MKVAISTWGGRVSPVFDVAKNLLVVDIKAGEEISRSELRIKEVNIQLRARRLASHGLDVIICGAISWPLEALLVSEGIRVISQICGDIEQVLQAFKSGDFINYTFSMPGSPGLRRRFRGKHRLRKPNSRN